MRTKRCLALLLTLAMLVGLVPTSVFAYYEDSYYDEPISIDVCTEGKTYSLYTEENLENTDGMTFLYVAKRDGRYYTPANPRYTGFQEVDSVYAIDITEYYDADTNSFSGISNAVNVGVLQYQQIAGSYMYLDGDMMFALSVPFESEGETWFEGGIRYYPYDDTYSYDRPLWQAKGDGTGYFYDSYIDWYSDTDEWVYGVLDLRFDGVNYEFALRNKSEEYTEARNADPENYDVSVDVTNYLYAAPCGHESYTHSAFDAPTCMDKGCDEYWYCIYCGGYFADAAFENEIGHNPVLPALDHNYGAEGCVNCGRPTPVYTKVNSYEHFCTLDPNASFIAVAEIDDGNGGKDYYVLKKEIATTMADIDEDGQPDVLQVDDNDNGIADILETDANGDGVADVMDYDGIYSGEPDGILDSDEIWEYLFYLEMQYTNGYIPSLHTMGAIPVKPADDGSISVNGLGALEWIMERTIPDEDLDEQYYGDGATKKDYENDFRFRIPNFWIRSVVTIDNNFYQQPYDQGDSKWWGVLFGKDGKALDSYLYEPLYGESYPDDAAILYTEAFYSLNTDGQLAHALRFLVNGEEKNFIMTSDSFWEELEGTQYPIYLYSSDAGGEYHEHIWSSWTKTNEENHKRVCTVDGCMAFDLGTHNKDENRECTPDTENYELGHWVACTDCGGEYHDYHTRETTGGYYGKDYWRDAQDGIHHAVYCTECGGPVEFAEHRWSDWYRGAKEIDGEWVMGHYRTCEKWPCEAQMWQAECIYDEGTVTKEPTCTENGIKEYVCIAEDCACDTKYRTEEIPATDHDWGEWSNNGDGTHTRSCDCNATETLAHTWGSWTAQGGDSYQRECADCSALENMTLPQNQPVNTTNKENAANTNLADTDIELIENVLTDEEQSQVAEGADVKVYLKVEDISTETPVEHQAEAEANVGDGEIGMYLDIDLFKQVGDNAETQVSETNSDVTITITIPEELINTDASVTRTYKIIRIHEGEGGQLITDVIEGVFNPEDNSFTFRSDKFSTYALVYVDDADDSVYYGDATGDGVIDGLDVIRLKKYLANYNYDTGTSTIEISDGADATGDGVIDGLDVIRLKKYLANYNYDTGTSTIPLGTQ